MKKTKTAETASTGLTLNVCAKILPYYERWYQEGCSGTNSRFKVRRTQMWYHFTVQWKPITVELRMMEEGSKGCANMTEGAKQVQGNKNVSA
jgi:hypothetical protein